MENLNRSLLMIRSEGRAKNRSVEVLIQPLVLEDGTLNEQPE